MRRPTLHCRIPLVSIAPHSQKPLDSPCLHALFFLLCIVASACPAFRFSARRRAALSTGPPRHCRLLVVCFFCTFSLATRCCHTGAAFHLRSMLVGSAWPARTSGSPRPCFACFLFKCAPQCCAQVFRPCTALHRPGLPGFFFLSRFARPGQLLPRKAGHSFVVKARRSRLFAAVPPALIPALPA